MSNIEEENMIFLGTQAINIEIRGNNSNEEPVPGEHNL